MSMKVAKFGGSSVADVIQIKKLKEIVTADPDIHYVVVSAPGKRFDGDSKITDLLYACKSHVENNLPYEQLYQVIRDRFNILKMNLGADVDMDTPLDEIIKKVLEEDVSRDFVASRGEYLNAILIAAYLGFDFVDAAGVVQFNERGRFLPEETNEAMKEALKGHDYAVVPGFYGSKPDGDIKTFTRGGSDITGAIISRAVDADLYENWTDVSGFLMADPRIVENPKPIGEISYRELRELSYMGAQVLHEDAIQPVRVANIPINIRNTNIPDDPGTLITAHLSDEAKARIVTGVAGSKDFTVIGLFKTGLHREKGFVRRMVQILEDFDIPLEHMPSGIDTISVIVSNDAIDGRIDELVEEFENQLKPDTLEVFEDVALLAIVGEGMSFRPGTSARIFNALAEAGVNIRMIDQGSTEMNIIIGVQNKDFETATRAIYEAFA